MPSARFTRRRVLGLGLLSAGALVVSGVGAGVYLRGCAPSRLRLRAIDAHQYLTLERLVEALFTADAGCGVDVAALELPRAFDVYLADEPEEVASQLRNALLLLELGPVLDGHGASPFSRLSVDARARFFEGWMRGDDLTRRKITVALRKFFNLSLYDRPELWPHLGYPGPAFGGAE